MADPDRRTRAKIPPETAFQTKPQLLRAMIERALAAAVPFRWVAADEAYGDNGPLHHFLETTQIGYVLAVSRDHQITTEAGKVRADVMATQIPGQGWQRLSCGAGSKGVRWYDWALVATSSPDHRLLIRRSISAPGQLAFYLTYSPHNPHNPDHVPLRELVRVAGIRWTVEEAFQAAKNEAALDHYQVRLYQAWYRHSTLAMLALAFLAVTRAAHLPPSDPPDRLTPADSDRPHPQPTPDPPATIRHDQTIVTSANEIRRLFALLTRPPIDLAHIRHWFRWRLRHQSRARRCHYQQRQLR
ncbi:hypothetical protein Aple_084020 [Acrocarpospora pleiomorpha]|uniref:Transposase IS701-like DDE domain-containing protein n=1 Tax=Acrocarpospora pleiomorpha TaxID=90975 RepID=A0A5M3Y163_9ACTN|nr:IS701 family transposase [Acrocarpospora pleiomorpha]GES25503.1 hypothetical protein Aple_084020 [Acrocarpospora pleiomorpha]